MRSASMFSPTCLSTSSERSTTGGRCLLRALRMDASCSMARRSAAAAASVAAIAGASCRRATRNTRSASATVFSSAASLTCGSSRGDLVLAAAGCTSAGGRLAGSVLLCVLADGTGTADDAAALPWAAVGLAASGVDVSPGEVVSTWPSCMGLPASACGDVSADRSACLDALRAACCAMCIMEEVGGEPTGESTGEHTSDDCLDCELMDRFSGSAVLQPRDRWMASVRIDCISRTCCARASSVRCFRLYSRHVSCSALR
mmetsp:Transcript_19772/g.51590  ORF Transcript_19772/g.51590 Transcript_19772/m.51590 type:complete len:259 (-) Transcript_19772:34-810(-)